MARFSSCLISPASSIGRPSTSMMRPRVPVPTGTEIGAGAGDLHATAQAVAGAQGDGAHHAVAQLLLNFERQALLGERGTLVGQGERFINLGHVIAGN